MISAAVVLVVRYGADVPLWDDFVLVPVLTGETPLTADWLWAQHNEHRIALSKLVLLGAFDFRALTFARECFSAWPRWACWHPA